MEDIHLQEIYQYLRISIQFGVEKGSLQISLTNSEKSCKPEPCELSNLELYDSLDS